LVITPEHKPARICAVDARVAATWTICRDHVGVELLLREFPASQPGQFLQLRCGAADHENGHILDWRAGGFPSLDESNDWRQREPFLRRPFSIADQRRDDDGQTHIVIISRNVGPATARLERLVPGDALNITGPLGHGFEIPSDPVPMMLVGGGVGIPPLLYLARRLSELGHRDMILILGATTRELLPVHLVTQPASDGQPLPCVELPGDAPFGTIVTTDDGSLGMPGLVTDGLRQWHSRRPAGNARGAIVFACGPAAMLKAVAELTRKLELDCQLSIERNMACGLGTCLSCVARVRDETRPEGWRWALACLEGPVFQREQLRI
jgi:dihydroorotate dehydrogenase electron transfer subunit